ncbi:hypothetical protein Tco_1325267, partial [Tanacetum coccineum]
MVFGDLFGQNLERIEVLNQGLLTPERMPTRASNGDKIFSNQVKAQFKGNECGLPLEGIDLVKLKQKIPKMKWKTKGNFRDCGIFTMLHMESFNGGTATNWDCGLVVESELYAEAIENQVCHKDINCTEVFGLQRGLEYLHKRVTTWKMLHMKVRVSSGKERYRKGNVVGVRRKGERYFIVAVKQGGDDGIPNLSGKQHEDVIDMGFA